MTKEEILEQIRLLASQGGGRIGLVAFLKTTGISEGQLWKHWATWNEALDDAGLPTRSFARPRTTVEEILEPISRLIMCRRKWPAIRALIMARNQDQNFPDYRVVQRYMKDGTLAAKLRNYCADNPEFSIVREIALQHVPKSTPIERAAVQGYVYLMKSGRRYKIGHTNSPARRHREIRLNLPDPTTVVHSIETDDPNGIEVYWHKRFEKKQVHDTEFFQLDAGDVAAFKRRKYQ